MAGKVTVVIPNYNGLKFMEPCFAALEAQSEKNFDVLVVDNGSTDGSVEWLKESGIPSVFLPENIGFPGAVNIGIKKALPPQPGHDRHQGKQDRQRAQVNVAKILRIRRNKEGGDNGQHSGCGEDRFLLNELFE